MKIEMNKLEQMIAENKSVFIKMIPEESRASLLPDFDKPVSDSDKVLDYITLGFLYYRDQQEIGYNNFRANIKNWCPSKRKELLEEVMTENFAYDTKEDFGINTAEQQFETVPGLLKFYRDLFGSNEAIKNSSHYKFKLKYGELSEKGIKSSEEREAKLDKFVKDLNSVCVKYGYSDTDDVAEKLKEWDARNEKLDKSLPENCAGKEAFEAGYNLFKDLDDMLTPLYNDMKELGYTQRDLCA